MYLLLCLLDVDAASGTRKRRTNVTLKSVVLPPFSASSEQFRAYLSAADEKQASGQPRFPIACLTDTTNTAD
jgi:hypothetical protein